MLREFPGLRELCRSQQGSAFRYEGDRFQNMPEMVLAWRENPEALTGSNSTSLLNSALRSLGVFQVTFELAELSAQVEECQARAFESFVASEAEISARLKDAIFRYAQAAEADQMPFKDLDIRIPESPEDLTHCIEFGSQSVPLCSAEGVSPLEFHFNPDWEPEHGCIALVWDSQVIFMGDANEHYDFLKDPPVASKVNDTRGEVRKLDRQGDR